MFENHPKDQTVDALRTGDFTEESEPFSLFHGWIAEAVEREPNDPTAMALATVDAQGLPNVRMVLLKNADERGFVIGRRGGDERFRCRFR